MARPLAALAALSLLVTLPSSPGRAGTAVSGESAENGNGNGNGDGDAATSELTAAEQDIARKLAEVRLAQKDGASKGHLYFVRAELYRDKALPERLAHTMHYRYEGDLTLYTVVSLTRGEVVGVESRTQAVTPFSSEEIEIARQLALASPAVKAELASAGGPAGFELEALPVRAAQASDPMFGHRVLHILFRRGNDYLRGQVVMVDLNQRSVIIEPAATGKGK